MAKSARGSSENLFSISGAADALNRSRRTVTKALANVKPAAIRHGLKLWRIADIIAAINNHTEAPLITRSRNGGSEVLTGLAAEAAVAFEAYDRAYDALKALPTLQARRAAARRLQPLFSEAIQLMRDRDRDAGLHPEHVDLKADKVAFLMVRNVEGPCRWSLDEAWGAMYPDDGEDEEAA
jgi:hypothetical protein